MEGVPFGPLVRIIFPQNMPKFPLLFDVVFPSVMVLVGIIRGLLSVSTEITVGLILLRLKCE